MKRSMITVGMIAAFLGFASVGGAAPIVGAYVETFDSGSATSWNYGYGSNYTVGPITYSATGGNPGACISGAADNLYAVWTTATSAYGDMTGLTLTIDIQVTNAATGNAEFYVGSNGTYYVSQAWSIGADVDWTTHTAVLEISDFTLWTQGGAGTAPLADVLKSPDDIGMFFGGGIASGAGNVLVDNFGTVATVPEPATLSLLVLGGLAMLKRWNAQLRRGK
jgi:hypothetical protein